MWTLIWLVATTIIGGLIGNHFFDAAILGSIIGFLVGLCLRFFADAADGIFDAFT
jgi:hypothetical protein